MKALYDGGGEISGVVLEVGDKVEGLKITEIIHDRFSGGLTAMTDRIIHHSPQGDYMGADWFETTSFHFTEGEKK